MRDTAAAEGVSVIDTAAFAATTSNWYGRYAQDGIHPNDAGYQLLVSGAVYPALEPMVAKLRCQ
jgi:lysophospholipase L1-like esterase